MFVGTHVESMSSNSSFKKRKCEESELTLVRSKILSSCGPLKPAPFFYYTDRSNEVDKDPLSPIIPLGQRIHLPGKMHVILGRSDLADIVSWRPHGRSWQIHKPDEFRTKVMPQYWGKCTVASFLRQASTWGFLRLANGEDRDSYYHEYFLRGMPHLCKKMRRSEKKAVDADARKAKRKYEPNLQVISNLHPLVPNQTDAHHMDMLRAAMQDNPNARMAFGHESFVSEQSNPIISDGTAQPVVPHNVVDEVSFPPPLQQEPLQQSTPLLQPQQIPQLQQQNEEAGSEAESMQDMVNRQQELLKLQTFLSPCVMVGAGSLSTWKWFMNWWSCTGSAPTITDEEEYLELQRVPVQERLNAKAEVLGASVPTNNLSWGEQYVQVCLLKDEIDNLPSSDKAELMRASSTCKKWMEDDWLMLFLRVENFDKNAAAKRMARYWSLRVDNLGREKAFLPFTIKNAFLEEHMYTLKMGYARILPATDIYGRSIVIFEPGRAHGKVYITDILVRSVLYVLHATIERPDFGKNGIVVIADHKSMKLEHGNTAVVHKIFQFVNSAPFCIKAIHLCRFQSFFKKMTLPVLRYFMGPFLRLRVEVHREEGERLLQRLQQFGLPPDRLPSELGGSIELNHEEWISSRLANDL